MGHIVIACYRPKEGRADALAALMKTHVARLRAEGLVTDRAPVLMRASDGTLLEVFEWESEEAVRRAHENPNVQQMWSEFAAVCDYLPLAQLAETRELFAGFAPADGTTDDGR